MFLSSKSAPTILVYQVNLIFCQGLELLDILNNFKSIPFLTLFGKFYVFSLKSTKAQTLVLKYDLSNGKSMLTQDSHASCLMQNALHYRVLVILFNWFLKPTKLKPLQYCSQIIICEINFRTIMHMSAFKSQYIFLVI